ncbi:MAG: hypothetical protein ACLPXB_17925 [Thiobacillaceae bacterium]
MNWVLEFQDSRITSVSTNRGALALNFSAAYLHKSKGVPGLDAGTGWVQEAVLTFLGASSDGPIDIGEGWMIDGTLVAGGETMSCLPVPFNTTDNVSAEFRLTNGIT